MQKFTSPLWVTKPNKIYACGAWIVHADFLQKKVGNRIDTRYTPRINFVLDKGIKNSMQVTRILDEVLPKNEQVDEAETIDE